jgi:serine/threonine protein kinase
MKPEDDTFQQEPTAMAPVAPVIEQAGDTIGRYKLLQQVGEGGCGVVYMAEQTEPLRRKVALKVIKLGMDTKSVIARFEAERQALADDGSSQHCQSVGCGRDRRRPALLCHGVGARRAVDRLLQSTQGWEPPRGLNSFSRFVRPFSTLIKRGSSIATSSLQHPRHPARWSARPQGD